MSNQSAPSGLNSTQINQVEAIALKTLLPGGAIFIIASIFAAWLTTEFVSFKAAKELDEAVSAATKAEKAAKNATAAAESATKAASQIVAIDQGKGSVDGWPWAIRCIGNKKQQPREDIFFLTHTVSMREENESKEETVIYRFIESNPKKNNIDIWFNKKAKSISNVRTPTTYENCKENIRLDYLVNYGNAFGLGPGPIKSFA